MAELLNNVKQASTSTGTGTLNLDGAAAANMLTWAAGGATSGHTYSYRIDDGAAWEIGYGVYTSGSPGTLTRTPILSTNSNTAISLTGNALVGCVERKEDMIPSGTAFPSSPLNGDRFYRSDRNIEYYYNSSITQWLSTQLYSWDFNDRGGWTADFTADYGSIPFAGTYQLYIIDVQWVVYINIAAVWVISFLWASTANVNTTLTSVSTSGQTANTWLVTTTAINALLSTSAVVWFVQVDEQTGTSTVYGTMTVRFRLVG